MDLQSTVVFDQAELSEFVHEEIDSGPRRSHSGRQHVLTDMGNDGFHFAVFAVVGEHQENASQPFFA